MTAHMAIQEPAEPIVSMAEFTSAMACSATQVTVVTTNGPAGRFGVTVSAFSSVSADPPLVLVCINRRSPSVQAIEDNGCFCVNLLGTEQSDIANSFAGRPGQFDPYDFDCTQWQTAETGAPMMETANASFDCTIASAYDAGTHRIFIGSVTAATSTTDEPLVFSRRAFQALSPLNRNNEQ